jgi:uroporphyrinogen-III decarboxylase
MWGTDYAYNAGPFLSPAMFREFIMPFTKRRVQSVHAQCLPVIQHACGNNWKLLDFFVELGLDCYQSIQNSAGMDLQPLKEHYGGKIALWGGVGVEKLVSGTPEDVRADVRYALKWGKPGGGYILGASHSIAVGTNYDNYMAMLDEFHKLRNYA